MLIVGSLLLAAVFALLWGVAQMIQAISIIVTSYGQDSSISLDLFELVDAFLVAIALYIFAVSVYELFIGELALPDWMQAHNLHDLKAKLSGTIILVMAVKFLEKLIESTSAQDLLLFGVAISVVSGMLIAFSHFGGKD